jgi:S-adenosylmethionine hydrolase
MRRPIVFVTDYGRTDTYAAALVGAAWRAVPDIRCVDGTHEVPPGGILAGAYHLKALALAFDFQVVLCAVVDPGVGTARRAIAVELPNHVACVAPDNGLVSYLWGETPPPLRRAVELLVPLDISATFHGRDVFAPAAAELASGSRLDDVGAPTDDILTLDEAFAQREFGQLRGRVAVVDHFGNAITTIRDVDIGGSSVTRVSWEGGATERMVRTYDDIGYGIAALIGSAGHLEVAARGQAATEHGGPAAHAEVTVELL